MFESLLILIPLSVALAVVIGALFWWSGESGQFDDFEGPAERLLHDDDSSPATDSVSARANNDQR